MMNGKMKQYLPLTKNGLSFSALHYSEQELWDTKHDFALIDY
jgi:hypothetical protein